MYLKQIVKHLKEKIHKSIKKIGNNVSDIIKWL